MFQRTTNECQGTNDDEQLSMIKCMPERRSLRIAGESAAPIEIVDSDEEDDEDKKLKAMEKAAELADDIEVPW